MVLGKRKYSGGSTGANKSRKTTSRKKYIPRYRWKPKPGRYYASSKRQYNMTKAVTNALRQNTETHLVPYKEYNQVLPTATIGDPKTYQVGFTTGLTHDVAGVPAYLQGFTPLGGFEFPADVRGNNIYVRNGQVMLQIDMDSVSTSLSVVEFRVIMFKSKRSTSTVDRLPPNQNLFLATDSSYWGWNTSGMTSYGVGQTGSKMMTALTNKQKFTIYRDQKFMLSPPQALYDATQLPTFAHQSTAKYPSMKRLKFDFPVYKKTTLDVNNHPVDLNHAFNIIILARPLAGNLSANDWRVSAMNGVTTFTDF